MYPPVASQDGGTVEVHGEDYFVVHTATYGAELWRTDALTSGVVLVCDAFPGTARSSPRQLTPFKGRLYFIADHPSFGQVLWSTDGTPLGTEVVRPTRADSTLPPVPAMALAPLGEVLVMIGRDAVVSVDHAVPPQLYILFVKAAMTDFAPVSSLSESHGDYKVSHVTSTGSRVYFTADDGAHGNELWALNAAFESALVKDILAPGDLKPFRK